MPNKKPDFSLVLACYNEAEHIETSIEKIFAVLDNTRYLFEIILIDDKSKDNTPNLIRAIVKKHKNTKAFFHKQNKGRGQTVTDGILKARSNVVGFIDIDCEVGPDYIPHFVRIIKNGEADVVIGRRYYPFKLFPPNYLLREILSRGYVLLTQILLGLPFEDTEAGYKFFNKKEVLPVLTKVQDKRWFWDTEIVTRSFIYGLIIKQVSVLFIRSSEKISTVRLIPDTIAYFKAIMNFYKTLDYEFSPPGILYKLPWLYPMVMKILFGQWYETSYKNIAKLIPNNSFVVDVCCGDGVLARYLTNRNIRYLGIDINRRFVLANNRQGIKTRLLDIRKDPIPSTLCVVLQRSLYQFENPSLIVRKLYKTAQKALIISESVHNLEENSLFNKTFLKSILPQVVGTNNKNSHFRFTEESFRKLLEVYHPRYIKTKGGRDLIAVIRK